MRTKGKFCAQSCGDFYFVGSACYSSSLFGYCGGVVGHMEGIGLQTSRARSRVDKFAIRLRFAYWDEARLQQCHLSPTSDSGSRID